jgi:hypothetical protein
LIELIHEEFNFSERVSPDPAVFGQVRIVGNDFCEHKNNLSL